MKQLAIGLMSGTSLDGIDVALVEIVGTDKIESATLIHGATYSYSAAIEQQIRQVIDPTTCTAALISSVHFALATEYYNAIVEFASTYDITLSEIELIGCHGQTIYHINNEEPLHPSSLQLGDGSVLSTLSGVPVVSNFRNADIAVGGTGAPLVPYVDYLLCKDQERNIALHNIGGISNLTYIPAGATVDDVVAFDTGPGNVMINEAMNILFDKPFDHNGEMAASGQVNDDVVKVVLSHQYFSQKPPKSTGREWFGRAYTKHIIKQFPSVSSEDLIASITFATAKSIADAYNHFILSNGPLDDVVLAGGGMHNTTLLYHLKNLMPLQTFTTSDHYGIDPDYKEAMAFAILGYETMHHRPANVPRATGAKKQVVLGQISNPR